MFQQDDFSIQGEILQDISKKGKEREWKHKKLKNLKVSRSFKRLKLFKRAERTLNCGTLLDFLECPIDGFKKLVRANFCKDRLCPICNWRRSIMLHAQILQILHEASNRQKIRYMFLTLTVKNCKPDDLKSTIDLLFNGFNRLFKYKRVDKNVIGWVRTLEITYNKKNDTYHPHFHVLIGVQPSYFNSSENYISQNDWSDCWQKALKVDYSPRVDVRVVKPKREGQTVEAATAETAKYSVKDTDYILNKASDTDRVIGVLAEALKGRRLIGFGKLFSEIKKSLNLKDIESEDADLVKADKEVECQCPLCKGMLKQTLYRWHMGYKNYFVVEGVSNE